MPTETAPDLPREAGGFRLLRTLGRGGMGVVYEAEELASGRRVALKVLAREHSLSDEAFERFRREARIAASVSDSACVFVFGAHQIEGSPAIAMELCAGETLEHRLRRKDDPIPIADAVRWTIEILDGLEAAHQSGVVHRDVKPSNCFITADGKIKVGDFGLARSLEHDVQLTQSGVFLGSPLYASPEQIKGRQVDFKSDIYSTGATLYALLTGRSPYGGTNLGEVLSRILSEPPDLPTGLRKDIPPGLEKVILRAMAREPAARYPTHAAMRDALRPFAAAETKASRPLRRFCGYAIDGAILSFIHLPLIGIWNRYDPEVMQVMRIGRFSFQVQSPAAQLSILLLGFLYFGFSEGFFRKTLGKWMTGQRVVFEGDRGGVSARPFLRAAYWSLPAMVVMLLRFLPSMQGFWGKGLLGAPPGVIVATLAMLSTMRARNGWRAVYELLSGTRVVAEPLPFARLVGRRAPPPTRLEPADLAPARFGEYTTLGRVGRTASGEIFEASDPGLDRRVWIHVPSAGAASIPASRRSMERPARLRWLDAIDVGGRRHEVFEAPGGARLAECAKAAGGIDWPTAHRLLTTLAEELDRPDATSPTIDQLWLDRSWNLRVLDEPLGEETAKPEAPLELLAHVTRACAGVDSGENRMPADLPEHAEPAVRSLIGLGPPFQSLADVRGALGKLAGRPQGLTWKIRGLQMLLSSGLFVMFGTIIVITMNLVALPQVAAMEESRAILRELRAGRKFGPGDRTVDAKEPTGTVLSEPETRDRRIVAADARERSAAIGEQLWTSFSDEDRTILERAKSEFAGVGAAEVAAARARVRADWPASLDLAEAKQVKAVHVVGYLLSALFAVAFLVFATFFALALRGGLSFRFLSIAVRDSKGRKAGRVRCALRALATAVPLVVLYAIPVASYFLLGPVFAGIAFGAAIAAHLGLAMVSLRNPVRGWQDRIVGTRLVPR